MSGIFLPLILILGVLSCVLVVFIAMRMDVIDHEAVPVHLTLKVLTYWPWLLWEIVKANIDVTLAILRGPSALQPKVFKLKASSNAIFKNPF